MGHQYLCRMVFDAEHVEKANAMMSDTLMSHLDIRYHVNDAGQICASMPVDHRTHQPMGLLHGGATVALAESLGSLGSALMVDLSKQGVMGVEVNANHLKSVRSGRVTATGELLHKGRTTHVWDIRVHNEAGELCAICRITNIVVDLR